MSITPPIPLRDEAAICLFGDVKARKTNGADLTKLMSPPVSVPNPYGWMRSDKRDSQKVLDHLAIENKYTVESQSHLESLRTSIYNSMLSKITETDFTAPTPNGAFVYYTRTFAGKSYKVHCRAPRDSSTLQPCNVSNDPSKPVMEGEVVLLDENVLAEGKSYCSVGTCKPSPDGSKLAYSLDTVGGETYDIFVVDIATGEVVDDSVKEVDAAVLWGDDVSIYFNRMDEEHRPYKTMRHTLKTDPSADELLFTEPDALFWLSLGKSQDGEYIFIESASKETSEVNFVHLKSKSKSKLGCVAARRSKVLYEVESRNGRFYISTNVGGTPNFHLVSCPAEANCEDKWEPVTFAGERIFDGENSRVLDGVCCLKSHMICYGREEGMPQIFVAKFDDGTDNVGAFERLEFDEDVYDVRGFKNLEYDTDKLWITYESMTTPQKTLKVDLAAGGRDLVKETVVSGYDPSEYECKRLEVLSRDGKTKIPCSMVWKKSLRKAEGTPQHVHLYGYGSYGACIEADFRSTRLALLDKGMIFVIAHIRGGGELGRGWYEMPNGAKYKCKKNTFYDFVDVAKSLVDSGMTEPAKLSAEGRSAGERVFWDFFLCFLKQLSSTKRCAWPNPPPCPNAS